MSFWKEFGKFVLFQAVGVVVQQGTKHVIMKYSGGRSTANGGRMTGGGTPDKRFNPQGHTKKDGTLDMRYKENW